MDNNKEIIMALVLTLISGIAIGIIVVNMPLDMVGWGSGELWAGVVTGANALALLVVIPFAHILWSRFGLGVCLCISGFAMAICTVLIPFLPDHIGLWFLVRFLIGLGMSVQWIGIEVWLIAKAPDHKRSQYLSYYAVAFCSGAIISLFLLQDLIAQGDLVYFIAVAFMVVSGLLPLLVHNHKIPVDHKENNPMWPIIQRYFYILLIILGSGILFAANWALLPLYAHRGGLSNGDGLWLTLIFIIGTAIGQIPLAWLADRVSKSIMVTAIGLVMILLLLSFYKPSTDYLTVVTFFLFGGGTIGLYVIGLSWLSQEVPAHKRALANAILIGAFEFGTMGGSPFAGAALELSGIQGWEWLLFIIITIITLSGAFGCYREYKNPKACHL